jgi:hypothetical protein
MRRVPLQQTTPPASATGSYQQQQLQAAAVAWSYALNSNFPFICVRIVLLQISRNKRQPLSQP